MGVTQKYKQQQQQARIQTNESNYLRGMYFSDVPLAEGYSRVLVNYDIDPLSGALTPRKGLQSLGIIEPKLDVAAYLNNSSGYNTIVKSKVCAHSDSVDPRKTNKVLQGIIYNTDTKSLLMTTGDPNITESSRFDIVPFSTSASDEYVVTEPFIIADPEVHGKKCVHNNFFKKPVGTFAFGNSYYTFVRRGNYEAKLIADLPNSNLPDSLDDYREVQNYADLMALTGGKGTPGNYFRFISGTSNGAIGYFDAEGNLQIWRRSEEALLHEVFSVDDGRYQLCYTKIGAEIQDDEQLLDKIIPRSALQPDKYYTCAINPDQINPTEAASWGYNMLLEDPYDFKCEETAVNMVTILGILPYGKDGLPVLTPRKNQEITLKGFYRAPKAYHSEAQTARYYATTKKRVTVTVAQEQLKEGTDEGGNTIYYYTDVSNVTHNVYRGYMDDYGYPVYYYYEKDEGIEGTRKVKVDLDKLDKETVEVTETRDPVNLDEIMNNIILYAETTDTVYNPAKTYYTRTGDGTTGNEFKYTEFTGTSFVDNVLYYEYLPEYSFGSWWHCTGDLSSPEEYYIVAPNKSLTKKHIIRFGATKPAASVALNGLEEGVENTIRVRWQMRSTNGADWDTLYDDVFKLSDYYKSHGDFAPFLFTTTMPNDEVMVRLLITDPNDIVSGLETGEEYVLSTNTIGLSLVSDELANTLNLSAKNFNLGECTGMCEWEQRLVLWGVPGALNTLFISSVNNPTFFPYPNNIDIFTDPIIAVHNYGNELLVLTTSELYRLIWDTSTDTWTHKLVQQNLHITESDTYLSCVIKNMFFFKSRDYYYMMVPKVTSASAVRGEVSIAPISKTIESLLDNFHNEVYNLAKVIVDDYNLPDFTDRLVNYFSYVDNTRVVVNYVYDLRIPTANEEDPYAIEHTTDSKYLYVQLIYDTEARTWVMKMFEAAHMLYASHSDAIQQDHFIDITPALDGNQLTLQYYKFVNTADDTVQYIAETGTAQAVTRKFKNYQYLDTGNREINTDLKKRFREFQFKIKNVTNNSLGFYTAFLVDGSLRRDLQKYRPRLITDDSGAAYVIVERELDPDSMSYNVTRIERVVISERMLQDSGELTPTTLAENDDPDRWVLDQSAFQGRTITKVRMPLSGKGLAPRAILLSTNELDYTLFGHLWVYRTMNSR